MYEYLKRKIPKSTELLPPKSFEQAGNNRMINGEELQNITKVWAIAIASLFYCYYVVRQLSVGMYRLVSLLPIFYLFITLPLLLSSVLLGCPTAAYLVFLGNFNLLLFAFNRGPLGQPLPLHLFLATALMPIKSKVPDVERQRQRQRERSRHHFTSSNSKVIQTSPKILGPVVLAIKIMIFAIIFWIYRYREYLHPGIRMTLDCCLVYLGVEMAFLLSTAPVRAIVGVEIKPLFNEPYLSTSLQDFWGRRWNLVVTGLLRLAVYEPVRNFFTDNLGRQWSLPLAFMAAFSVSGLMHEIIYYYLTRMSPTWEVTWFFVLHGACTACEVSVKKALNGRWRLHPAVSCPVTLGFIAVTASLLFFPQPTRNGIDLKIVDEYKSLTRLLLFRTP